MSAIRAVGLGLVLAACGLGTARAQGQGGLDYVELFQQLDANGDMIIERGEIPESALPAFEDLLKNVDTDHDGKIDREEYRAMLMELRGLPRGAGPSAGDRFRAMDLDGDGKVSGKEFMGPAPLFERLDVNKDGFLTRDEVDRFQPGAGMGAAERLRAMDKDGDGKVSKEEFTGPEPLFERLDLN